MTGAGTGVFQVIPSSLTGTEKAVPARYGGSSIGTPALGAADSTADGSALLDADGAGLFVPVAAGGSLGVVESHATSDKAATTATMTERRDMTVRRYSIGAARQTFDGSRDRAGWAVATDDPRCIAASSHGGRRLSWPRLIVFGAAAAARTSHDISRDDGHFATCP
jgi:hypothetical protein